MQCKRLDHQLCVRSDGQYRLCCASLEPENKENIKTHTPEEWFNSEMHKSAREKFAKDEWPDACITCRKKEEQGLESIRSGPRLYGPGTSHLDIRFGNSCNLKCISCWEMSSSSIAEEAVEMKRQGIIPVHNVLEIPHFNWASDEAIDQIVNFPLQEVYLTGGEPMMVKHLPKLLERLDSDVMIRFNTNCTIWNPKLEKLLKRFKVVNMAMSIDAYGRRNDYIRYGSNWNDIEENFKRYADLCKIYCINPTISILNAPYINELYEWGDKNNTRIEKNYLDKPDYLHLKNAPKELKEIFQDGHAWMGSEDADPNQIKVFKDTIKTLDSFRKINIKDYLPEVASAYGIS